MDLLSRLSSQVGDRTEESNRLVVQHCLENPDLLHSIAQGLSSKDAALIGDCAEVCTQTAETKPELIVPYGPQLAELITHQTIRVRWEAMHAIALIAPLAPEFILSLLPQIRSILHNDPSTIVRDYAIDCCGQVCTGNGQAAELTLPLLKEAITLWEGKHLARILSAMTLLATASPAFAAEVLMYGHDYANHPKSSVSKAAKKLIKTAGAV